MTTTDQQPAVQVKVTLPAQLHSYLSAQAKKYGLTMSSYVKHLILNDVRQADVLRKHASEKTEISYQGALEQRQHAVVVHDVEEFLDDLWRRSSCLVLHLSRKYRVLSLKITSFIKKLKSNLPFFNLTSLTHLSEHIS